MAPKWQSSQLPYLLRAKGADAFWADRRKYRTRDRLGTQVEDYTTTINSQQHMTCLINQSKSNHEIRGR